MQTGKKSFVDGPQEGYVVGLMSGTSGDGIDAALVYFRERAGSEIPAMELRHSAYFAYDEEQREQVFSLFAHGATLRQVAKMDTVMGQWFGEAARSVIDAAGLSPLDVAGVASHGQTVWHEPGEFTVQIGNPFAIAEYSGCPVISDFRRADMAVGGEGAPLVPYFDYACLHSDDIDRVLLNIGGIANLTYLPFDGKEEAVIAFDTGPGNMVTDGLMSLRSGGRLRYDEGGACAAKGRVDEGLVDEWIRQQSYFRRQPPKATGREVFGLNFVEEKIAAFEGWSTEDLAATCTYFVAKTIADGIRMVAKRPFELVVGGGGRHNQTLMDTIIKLSEPLRVVEPETFGIPTDMKEAMAFALLGWQFLHGRPANVPSATGAKRAVSLGVYTPRL